MQILIMHFNHAAYTKKLTINVVEISRQHKFWQSLKFTVQSRATRGCLYDDTTARFPTNCQTLYYVGEPEGWA